MNFKRLHYFSGLTISIFIFLHLLNHLFSLLGANAHIETMGNLRIIYRNIIVEPILFFVVFIQIFSGVKLYINKRKRAKIFFERIQIWTGLYLAFFLLFHSAAVLLGRYVLNLDTNFYFGASGLNTFPFVLFFVPYYTLAILSFFGHICAVHALRMKRSFLGLCPNKQAYVIFGFGCVFTLIIIYGLTNGFRGTEIPIEYVF